MLAKEGEKLVNDYEFYAAFTTSEDYRIVYNEKTLGFIPTTVVLRLKMPILLAGRKWEIKSIDEKGRVVQVVRTDQKSPIKFGGDMPEIAEEIVEEMRTIYLAEKQYVFVDEVATTLLQEARHWFNTHKLNQSGFVPFNGDMMIFTWAGSKTNNSLALMLIAEGLDAKSLGICILVTQTDVATLKQKLSGILEKRNFSGEVLAKYCENKIVEKHDIYLNEDLLSKNYASRYLDVEMGYAAIEGLLSDKVR